MVMGWWAREGMVNGWWVRGGMVMGWRAREEMVMGWWDSCSGGCSVEEESGGCRSWEGLIERSEAG